MNRDKDIEIIEIEDTGNWKLQDQEQTHRNAPTGKIINELIKTLNNADSISKGTFETRLTEARGANNDKYSVTCENGETKIMTPHGAIIYKSGIIDKLRGRHADNNITSLAQFLLIRLFDTLINAPQTGYIIVTTDELIKSGLYSTPDSVRVHFIKDYLDYLWDSIYLDFNRFINKKKTTVNGVFVFGAIERERGSQDYKIFYDIQHVNDLRFIFCGEFAPLGDVWDKLQGDAQRLYMYMLIQTRINATRISENLPKQDLSIKRSKITASVFCGFPLEFELKGNPNKNKQLKRFDNALKELKKLQKAGELEFNITETKDYFTFTVNQTQSGAYLQDRLCDITDDKKEKMKKKKEKETP